jgi:heme A synthase
MMMGTRREAHMDVGIGVLFGVLVILLYIMTILNYVVKAINRTFGARMKANAKAYKAFTTCMRFIVKNHRFFGMASFVFLIIHVFIQYSDYGYINQTGAVAAGVLLVQVGLGIYGSKAKKKPKSWLYIHRAVAVLLPIAIAIHVLG